MSEQWTIAGPGGSPVAILSTEADAPVAIVQAPEIDHTSSTDDTTVPGVDGTFFGVDDLQGFTVTFTLDVQRSQPGAMDALSALRSLWRSPRNRADPAAVCQLTAPSGRVTWGRPRQFAVDESLRPWGWVRVVCTFQAVADVWYGADLNTVSLPIAAATQGGLLAPLASPLGTTIGSSTQVGFTVKGSELAWPVFTVHGPINQPRFGIAAGPMFYLDGPVAYDQTLIVDTRPRNRFVTLDGKPVGLDPTSSLMRLSSLVPGTYEVALAGASSDGTARLDVQWRDAYPTY